MVDLVITGLVIPTSKVVPDTQQFESGATITSGQMVYLDAAAGKVAKLADSDTGTAAPAETIGIAVNDAGIGEMVGVALASNNQSVTFASAILTKGTVYYLSNTAGGVCPFADLGSADYVTLVGVATSTTVLRLLCIATGITI